MKVHLMRSRDISVQKQKDVQKILEKTSLGQPVAMRILQCLFRIQWVNCQCYGPVWRNINKLLQGSQEKYKVILVLLIGLFMFPCKYKQYHD